MGETERLLLRGWRDDDRAALLAMSTDPEVMRHFPAPMTEAQAEAFLAKQRDREARGDPFLHVVELRSSGTFLGFTGLSPVDFEAGFTPAVEIGWRLCRDAWGHGYATEAATTVLAHAFTQLSLGEVVSFTAVGNLRSRAVMQRLGMRRVGEFEHPALTVGHPLRLHVLYRIRRIEWQASRT